MRSIHLPTGVFLPSVVAVALVSVPSLHAATIEGYAWPPSVAQGDSIGIYVSTDAPEFDIHIIRRGHESVEYMAVGSLPGVEQPAPPDVWAVGCGWSPSLLFEVPTDWPSGVYVAQLLASGIPIINHAIFTLREDEPGSTGRILLQSSITTWQAYNNWGGNSLYDFNSTDQERSHIVSFKRPYAQGFGTGYFRTWQKYLVRWLESEGYGVEYCTSLDTHASPDLLSHYDLFISVGHDEYWSKEMRDNIEARIADGGNVCFLSGNTSWWQIRLTPLLDKIICYKDKLLDPFYGIADSLVTVNWHEDPLCRPENHMTGVSFRNGGYVNYEDWYPASEGYGDYTVYRAEHWVYEGT